MITSFVSILYSGILLFSILIIHSHTYFKNNIVDTLSLAYVAVDGNCASFTPCYSSIQQAIDNSTAGTIIKVSQGTYTNNNLSIIYINKPISIIGGYSLPDWENADPISNETILDAESISGKRVIYLDVSAVSEVLIKNFTIKNGYIMPYTFGAGIYIKNGKIRLENNKIINNYVSIEGNMTGGGAGVYIDDGDCVILGNHFQENSVGLWGNGSGVYINKGNVDIQSNIFEGNYTGGGGTIFVAGKTANVKISENILMNNIGQSIFIVSGLVDISNNSFERNSGSYGGAIHISSGQVSIEFNNFINNYSDRGGAIALGNGYVLVKNNYFSGNFASVEGGALFIAHGDFEVMNNIIIGNSANEDGGAITTVSPVGNILLSNNIIKENVASRNGGGINIYNGSVMMEKNLIQNNRAYNGDGGGMNLYNGIVVSTNDMIVDNQSPWAGISLKGGRIEINHMTIANNGLYAINNNNGILNILNSIIAMHTSGGISGSNSTSTQSIFFETGLNCSNGATCLNSLHGDPKFIDIMNGKYHLGAGSAAANLLSSSTAVDDIDGQPRPMQGSFDLGADEQPPLAKFSSDSPTKLGTATQFENKSIVCQDTNFHWDFGDGTSTGTEENPTLFYQEEGVFNVTLNVTCEFGEDETDSLVIVDGSPPYGSVVILGIGRNITLKLSAFDDLTGVDKLQVSNVNNFENVAWISYVNQMSWQLEENNTVFVRFKDSVGNISEIYITEGNKGIFLPLVKRN